jgi:hypothetical protein
MSKIIRRVLRTWTCPKPSCGYVNPDSTMICLGCMF